MLMVMGSLPSAYNLTGQPSRRGLPWKASMVVFTADFEVNLTWAWRWDFQVYHLKRRVVLMLPNLTPYSCLVNRLYYESLSGVILKKF